MVILDAETQERGGLDQTRLVRADDGPASDDMVT